MATSRTQIANQALSRLGARQISDIDDPNDPNAIRIANIYSVAFDEIARSHTWNCLTKRADLAASATAPAFGFEYAYPLPSDFIRLISLNGYTYSNQREDFYSIEGRSILTNASEAKIVYISRIESTQVNTLDALFVSAFVVLLASKLASLIKQDEQISQALLREYLNVALPQAMRVNATEKFKRQWNRRIKGLIWESRYGKDSV